MDLIASELLSNMERQLSEQAEIARFDPNEKAKYEQSLKYYRDMKGVIDTSFEEGKLEGRMEGKLEKETEFILNSHHAGLEVKVISQITGKSMEEINTIIKQYLP